MKKVGNRWRIIKALLMILLVFYLVFLYIDLFNKELLVASNTIKYSSMILVFIISLIIGKDFISHRDILLLRLGLFITLIADFFLLFSKGQYLLGVGLFCLVQILYYIRYKGEYSRNIIYGFGVLFLGMLFLYGILNRLIIEIDFLIILSIYYAICLLSSEYKGLNLLKSDGFPRSNAKMVLCGMIFFLLCDINVAAFNFSRVINISNSFLTAFDSLFQVSMWFFYLPSQVLLALSGYSKVGNLK